MYSLCMNKIKKMSAKHKLFTKNLAKHGGNQKDAYLDTYPESSVTHATSSASRLIKQHPEILDRAGLILRKHGVTEEKISKALLKKLKARKSIIVNNEIRQVSDNTTQMKAIELGMKGLGMVKDNDNSKTTINIQNNQAIILDKLDSRLDKVLQMFDSLGHSTLNKRSNENSTAQKVDDEGEGQGEQPTVDIPNADYVVNDTD